MTAHPVAFSGCVAIALPMNGWITSGYCNPVLNLNNEIDNAREITLCSHNAGSMS